MLGQCHHDQSGIIVKLRTAEIRDAIHDIPARDFRAKSRLRRFPDRTYAQGIHTGGLEPWRNLREKSVCRRCCS